MREPCLRGSIPRPARHGRATLDKPTRVEGRMGATEQPLFFNAETFHGELAGSHAQRDCHPAFPEHVSRPPNEIIYVMSW